MSELDDKLAARLREDEGIRLKYYKDTKGNLTIGIGHNLENGIDIETCNFMFGRDRKIAIDRARDMFELWDSMSVNRQIVVSSMIFQIKNFPSFKKFIEAVREQDWKSAAHEMRDSKWHREDSPARAERLAVMMEQG